MTLSVCQISSRFLRSQSSFLCFAGVHYRVQVAFRQRPANASPPSAARIAAAAKAEEEAPLLSELQWHAQFVRDWCQQNSGHVLVTRKPAVMRWRAWYFRCLHFDLATGDVLLRRWREWMREMAWEQLSVLQRYAFEGSLHLIREVMAQEAPENPFLSERNILFYAVLSRSVETVQYFLDHGFSTADKLYEGESWTGFTALHVAIFIQHRQMASLFWNDLQFNVNVKDLFFGSVLDYCRLLGLVTNAEVYFKGRAAKGYDFGYMTLEHVCQVALRHPLSWDSPDKDKFERRNVQTAEAGNVYVNYWNKKSKEMERMPLAEWSDLVRCVYQPFVSASDAWLDELMFNGVYIDDPRAALRVRYAAHLKNQPTYSTPTNVFMSYVNTEIGFTCYALRDLAPNDWITTMGGFMHTDRYKWKDVEKTTEFRLNFMRQIHELGDKGRGIIKKPELPRYVRRPDYNLAIPGTSYFLNQYECGNMARIINHAPASQANARMEIVWAAGLPQVLILATKRIAKGEQVLMDYTQFWRPFEELKQQKQSSSGSISNFDESDMLLARDEKQFFRQDKAKDLTSIGMAKIDLDGEGK